MPKTYTARHNTLWFNNSLHTAKRSLRIKERNWLKSKSSNDLNIFKHSLSNYRKLIKTAKNKYTWIKLNQLEKIPRNYLEYRQHY